MEMVRISFSLSPRTVGNTIPEIGREIKSFFAIPENISGAVEGGKYPPPGEIAV